MAYCREESDPRYITNAADVKLRSFSTKVGRWGTLSLELSCSWLRGALIEG